MPACAPTLLTDAACLTCLTADQLLAVIACQLATANGMSCDPAILLAEASCLTCLNPQQLLAIIACQLSGGSVATSPIEIASGPPPDGSNPFNTAFYWNQDAQNLYVWDGASWNAH